jgi:hypothetical protein
MAGAMQLGRLGLQPAYFAVVIAAQTALVLTY